MSNYLIRKATEQDVTLLAQTAALAFEKDPLLIWLGKTPELRHEISGAMFRSDWRMNKKFDLIYCEDNCNGFAVWLPPGAHHSLLENIRMMVDVGWAVHKSCKAWQQFQLFRRIDAIHPKEAHYYLSFLGVRPEMQGKGLGRALIEPVLERCDREQTPAYLETETEKNVRFYEKHGFQVKQELGSKDGAVHIWTMWRNPK